ncbi:MAG: calcium-binding protein, partial [Cyanobacteria bacterium J06649_11]
NKRHVWNTALKLQNTALMGRGDFDAFNLMRMFKVGDYVKVLNGQREPDYQSILMDNWYGQITGIVDDLIEIKLDLKTIIDLPFDYLIKLEQDGLSIEVICLEPELLELRDKRPFSKDEEKLVRAKLYWISLFEDRSKDYFGYFSDTDVNDYFSMYAKWIEYLTERIEFPVMVKVVETMRGGLKLGTQIKLLDFDDIDDKYGILGIGKSKNSSVTWPICDLEVINPKSKAYQPLRDYRIWFANM